MDIEMNRRVNAHKNRGRQEDDGGTGERWQEDERKEEQEREEGERTKFAMPGH